MIKQIIIGLVGLSVISMADDLSLIKAKLETGYYLNTELEESDKTPVILTFILKGKKCKAFGTGTSSSAMMKMNRGKIILTNGYCKKSKFKFEGYFYDRNKMFGAKGERTDNILTIRPQIGYFSTKNIKNQEVRKKSSSSIVSKITQ